MALPLTAQHIQPVTLLTEINAHRTERRLDPLRLNSALESAAMQRMQHMLDLGYWSHEAPDGTSPFVWLRGAGYLYSSAGENLARGFETAEVLVESWMESPGHRSALLSDSYVDVGFAVVEGSTTGRSTGYSVVAMFGRPLHPQPLTADASTQ